MNKNQKSIFVPLVLIGTMFAVLGFAIGVNAFFIPYVKEVFNISTMMSYLLMTATFSSYVVFGIPSASIIKKVGYRKGMVVAFLLMAIGFFIIVPASRMGSFPLFLLALFINGMGQTLLTGAVNTYVSVIGSHESAARRIAIMGICNKFSYAGASFILAIFIDLVNIRIEDVTTPFYFICAALILMGILYYFAPLPEVKAAGEDEDTFTSEFANKKTSIFQFPHLLLGVVALFFDVGLETIALGTINDYAVILNLTSPENYIWFTSGAMIIGYILGVIFIPKIISQRSALLICTLLGVVMTISIELSTTITSIYFVAALGLANSLLWPAIWPLAIADLGKFTKMGSSLLVMGIVGGAILPLLFGYFADISGYQKAYWVCLVAYIYIFYYAIWGSKLRLLKKKSHFLK